MTRPDRTLQANILLVLFCASFLSVYCTRVVRVYLAQRSAESIDIAGLERAIRLVPDNAMFPHLLGLQFSAREQDSTTAIANLRQAVRLNPYSGRYWLDLAAAYQQAGNAVAQNDAVQSALAAEPGSPEIAAEAAQYFLASADWDRALPLVRQALEKNPQAAPGLLLECWRATHDASLLLARAIPADPEIQLAFLRLLTGQKEKSSAALVWQHLVASGISFPPQLATFYLDDLVREHAVPAFARAWRGLASLAPLLQRYLPTDNLIVNGSFEQPILNYGLDWRHESSEHVVAGIDEAIAHSGLHSLALSYDGNPAYLAGWSQFVPVQADSTYEFSAWIKSENLTTSSGPRLAISDAYSGANLLLMDDVLDTHPWHRVAGTFQVPAGTELVVTQITRAPANTKIKGRLWVDDLRLERK